MREFASLSAQETLHIAVFIEERNAQIYMQFAELFDGFGDRDSLEIAEVFREMAGEERRHGTMLQQRYFELYGADVCPLTEDQISEFVEVPRLPDGQIFAITRAGLGEPPRHKALEIALAAEHAAMRYYTQLAGNATDPDLKDIYRELAEIEDGHADQLRRKMHEARAAARAQNA